MLSKKGCEDYFKEVGATDIYSHVDKDGFGIEFHFINNNGGTGRKLHNIIRSNMYFGKNVYGFSYIGEGFFKCYRCQNNVYEPVITYEMDLSPYMHRIDKRIIGDDVYVISCDKCIDSKSYVFDIVTDVDVDRFRSLVSEYFDKMIIYNIEHEKWKND